MSAHLDRRRGEPRELVIVGAGFAGVGAAMGAAEVVDPDPGSEAVRITVVNDSDWLTLRPRLYESDLDDVRAPLRDVLPPTVDLVIGRVTQIDRESRAVVLESPEGAKHLPFDGLVLAAGSRLRRPRVAGDASVLHDVDTYEAALATQHHVSETARSDRPVAERFGIVVVGAGLAGLETATELAGTIARLAAEAGNPGAARVVLVDPAPTVDALLGPAPAEAIASALTETEVQLVLGRYVTGVSESGVVLDDGQQIVAGTVVWTAGLEAHPVVRDVAASPDDLDALGRVIVDDYLRVPGETGVFAAGDVASAPADDDHRTVMSCQHAIPTGRTAGRNAAAALLGLDLEPFTADPYVTCIDLGAAGGLFTVGWDRLPKATGAEGKEIKRQIIEMIHPSRWGEADARR